MLLTKEKRADNQLRNYSLVTTSNKKSHYSLKPIY